MIEVKRLVKRYESVLALANVSFEVREGEIFGFLGPNGAGKTTTIKILTGQIGPTAGRVRVAGFDCPRDTRSLHRIVGVVPEIQNLYERMTAMENLSFFAKLYDVGHGRVEYLLEKLELSRWARTKVKNFSLGMKQRLLLARGLLPNPRILFLDEPTKGLDPRTARSVRKLIKEVNGDGTVIFLTTHYMEEADELCHRVAIIDRGKLVACDTPATLKAAEDEPVITITLRDPVEHVDVPRSDAHRLRDLLTSDRFESVRTKELTLEDVFISLTGRTLE